MERIRVTQLRSAIGRQADQGRTLRSLGLKRIGDSAEHDDVPSIRGMVNKVVHLVKVEPLKARAGEPRSK
ncbi:MAG: 50S ribosomal protein L30 [Actinomycetota bacterium]|jgi:large subunit ribosomal protein L30